MTTGHSRIVSTGGCYVDMNVPGFPVDRLRNERDAEIVGGVSANRGLRKRALALSEKLGFRLHVPAIEHCTDNAAMIAITGHFRLQAGQTSPLTLTAEPALAFG